MSYKGHLWGYMWLILLMPSLFSGSLVQGESWAYPQFQDPDGTQRGVIATHTHSERLGIAEGFWKLLLHRGKFAGKLKVSRDRNIIWKDESVEMKHNISQEKKFLKRVTTAICTCESTERWWNGGRISLFRLAEFIHRELFFCPRTLIKGVRLSRLLSSLTQKKFQSIRKRKVSLYVSLD